ncbi:MAG TPA: tRNA (adenosine(37)-N6)-threonylcarbamoyltransferase complex dimerization subunit type 1 TsaB [Holophaga sp.]|nr:tRNA (adenosine(37)-N6)-threonylcarbamoyltransferase complex dimerization subunit type 1 TsaB [Holophaga sp.]
MADCGPVPGDGPLLVLDTVTPELTVTLGRPGGPLLQRQGEATGRSAEVMAPLIAAVLDAAGIAASALGGVACVRGPGSFTGIRVALATALGLSLGAGVPMAGLDALPLLAASAAGHATGVIAVVTHARAGQVYLQSFLADGDVMPLGPPESLFLADAALRLADDAAVGPLWLAGEGASRHRELLAAAVPQAVFLGPASHRPEPAVLLAAAARAAYGYEAIVPLYLRPCDAEENLAAFAALRGLTPEAATAMLRRARAEG